MRFEEAFRDEIEKLAWERWTKEEARAEAEKLKKLIKQHGSVKAAVKAYNESRKSQMEKVAKDKDSDTTAHSVRRGAGLGALILGGHGAVKGALQGHRNPFATVTHSGYSRAELKKLQRVLGPMLKGINVGGGAAAHGLRGALKGALLGGAAGYVMRPKKKDK